MAALLENALGVGHFRNLNDLLLTNATAAYPFRMHIAFASPIHRPPILSLEKPKDIDRAGLDFSDRHGGLLPSAAHQLGKTLFVLDQTITTIKQKSQPC